MHLQAGFGATRRGLGWPMSAEPPMVTSPMTDSAGQSDQEAVLARLIVQTLNLETPAEQVDPMAPLYGEGLGLDSIDMLEVALVVSQQFGVKLRADDKNNREIFTSLRSLNAYIQAQRGP